jgi:hypothetical protein
MEKNMKDEISGNKENLVGTVKFDKNENVAEPVGNIETLDTDGDGVVDTINHDVDGDGITDMSTKMSDIDGDGITDTIATDYDGDGIADTTTNMLDTDGDGITDTITRDLDGDGITDTTTNMLDTDGDGITDTITRDLDGDGIADTATQFSDIDGDGITDTIATDSNMDGFADNSMVFEDINADGIADQASFYEAGNVEGMGVEGLDAGGMGVEGLDAGGMGVEGLEGAEGFDPTDLLDACFSEDMKVLTSNGYIPIKDVKKGMEIVSYDEKGKTFYNRAVNTIQMARKRQLWKLVLTDSTELKVTGNHRLLTENGWNKVSEIKTGDLILSVDGLVAVKKTEKTNLVGTVFNLHTRMEKNYIVEGVVAHNFTHLFKLRTLLSKYLVDIFVTEKTSPRNLLPSSDKL